MGSFFPNVFNICTLTYAQCSSIAQLMPGLQKTVLSALGVCPLTIQDSYGMHEVPVRTMNASKHDTSGSSQNFVRNLHTECINVSLYDERLQ